MDLNLTHLILQDRLIAYAITDRELNVVEVGGAVSILHRDSAPWLGRSLPELVPELVGNEAVLSDILAGKLPRLELALVNREFEAGGTCYLTIIELPYRDAKGEITGLIHLVDDVPELGSLKQRLVQHRNELRLVKDRLDRQNLELAAANAELRRLDEMKSMFVSVAAHELRTPLTSIQGFVEILLDEEVGPLTAEQRESLEIVEQGARRLLRITNNLLDVTRIEAGRVELILKPLELSTLIEGVVAEFAPRLENRKQSLAIRVAPDLPAALCDETRMVQIIGNLLSNANKYTPAGGKIEIEITLAEEEGFLQIGVKDNGLGIAVENQASLFERFVRADSARRSQAPGAGLGLYITRSLVELHGGRIWFESEPDRGSTFHVTCPIAGRPSADVES